MFAFAPKRYGTCMHGEDSSVIVWLAVGDEGVDVGVATGVLAIVVIIYLYYRYTESAFLR
eukprot:m.7259 g.7259  ORF g.7259 m.7259 type:complete len:60 (+) comp3675_c0_seq1:2056-2235(+)